MTIYYQVYGLTFRSDCKLPDLDPVQEIAERRLFSKV